MAEAMNPNAYMQYIKSLEQQHGAPGFAPMTEAMFAPHYPVSPGIPYNDAQGNPVKNQAGQVIDYYGKPIPPMNVPYGAGRVPQNPTYINQHGQIVDAYGRIMPQAPFYNQYGSLDPFNFRDTQYSVHPREIEKIDRIVARVLRAVRKAPRMFRSIFTGRGQTKFKHYENVDPMDPIMGKDFTHYEPAHEELKEFEKQMLAVHKDYMIGMVARDASMNSNYLPSTISERTVAEFTALVSDFIERMTWRGGDILTNNPNNASNPDPAVYGIATSPNITAVPITATTVAGSITSVGDFADAIIQLAAPLIKAFFPTPYTVVVTPGVLIQSMKNRNAFSDKTDLLNVNELGREEFGIDIVNRIEWTPHLLKVEETNSNARIMVIAPRDQAGMANALIAESYPAWHRPLNLATQIGIAGKIGWYGAGIIRREASATMSDDLTLDVY